MCDGAQPPTSEAEHRADLETLWVSLGKATALLVEARAWIDKHKCCTEERKALVARIDEAGK